MDRNEIVSIIIPSYNSIRSISRTIDSVLFQNYVSWEAIVIDDCSIDGTLEFLMDKYSDPRIRFDKNTLNLGVSATRNKGLNLAKGKYITFLDAGDEIDPEYLSKQIEFIQNNGPIVSSSYRRNIDGIISEFHIPTIVKRDDLLNGNPLSCLTTMYDRTVFPDIRFNSNYNREDLVFWLDLLDSKNIKEVKCNHEVLATYNIESKSRSHNKFKMAYHQYVIYRKHEHKNIFSSIYHLFKWMIYGIRKYY